MIDLELTELYIEAFKTGFNYYGLNGFYEMHEDVCNNPDNPWGYGLSVLNSLSYDDFKSLAELYLDIYGS